MTSESLAAALARAGSPVALLRDSAARPHTFSVTPEFTNGARSSGRGRRPARCSTSRTT
jgi:hypothetical protein